MQNLEIKSMYSSRCNSYDSFFILLLGFIREAAVETRDGPACRSTATTIIYVAASTIEDGMEFHWGRLSIHRFNNFFDKFENDITLQDDWIGNRVSIDFMSPTPR
jgi:hypothetical protein